MKTWGKSSKDCRGDFSQAISLDDKDTQIVGQLERNDSERWSVLEAGRAQSVSRAKHPRFASTAPPQPPLFRGYR
jgi:hypothetical protein